MLAHVEIVYKHKKINILFQDKERPVKTKLMLAKLQAVLVCVESDFAQC